MLKAGRVYRQTWKNEKIRVLAVEEQRPVTVKSRFTGREYPYNPRVDLEAEIDGRTWMLDLKCLPARAHVAVPGQGRIHVDSLGESSVFSWDERNKTLGISAATTTTDKAQPVWEVALSNGIQGPFGATHPILTIDGWRQASDLRPGDLVGVPLGLPDVPDAPISDALITATCMLLCDGALTTPSLIYTKNGPAREFYMSQLRTLGLDEAHPDQAMRFTSREKGKIAAAPQGKGRSARVSTVRLSVATPMHGWLGALGVKMATSPERELPPQFWGLSNRQAGLALGAFWSGDAWACVVDVGARGGPKSRQRAHIKFGSQSRALCAGVQHLLLQLGVVAGLAESFFTYKGARRSSWAVTVLGKESRLRFLDLAIDGIIKIAPNAHVRLTRRGNSVASLEEIREVVQATHEHGVWRDRGPRKRPDGTEVSALSRWTRTQKIEGSIWWVPVASALYTGDELCYATSVPGPSTFVANGMITHNTTSVPKPHPEDAFAVNIQFLGMARIGRQRYGAKFGGLVVNMIEFNGDKVRCYRRQPPFAGNALADWAMSLAFRQDQITTLIEAGTDPWHFPKAMEQSVCRAYSGCEAFEVCRRGRAALDDPDFDDPRE